MRGIGTTENDDEPIMCGIASQTPLLTRWRVRIGFSSPLPVRAASARVGGFTGANQPRAPRGGAGKTRLVLQMAAEVARQFAVGVAFIWLASLKDPTLVVPTIARGLGVSQTGDDINVIRLSLHQTG